MKKATIFLMAVLIASPLLAQQRTGNLYGKVVDEKGDPLPGVTVTLTGSRTAPIPMVTSGKGIFRFVSIPPADDYALKAELRGFKTHIWENMVISVGRGVDFVLSMTQGALEEAVTVVASTPVVDSQKTTVGLNITREVLQSIPSARDPWDILQTAPGIINSQDNVGGIFAGQKAAVYSRAGMGSDNTWSLDGLVVSDSSSTGDPSTYWDFDVFEEMNITSGSADVTQQTGGIQINLVSRRGGNALSVGGRFYGIDSSLQSDTFNDDLAAEGLAGVNKFDRLLDFGVNFGLSILKDKLWFWGSLGVQDIKTFTVAGNPEDTLLKTGAAKINLQFIPQNRLELFAQGNRTEKRGLDQSSLNPEGMLQRPLFAIGFPVVKIQDEHTFGDSFYLSAKWGAYNGGFELTPQGDPNRETISIWDEEAQRYYGAHNFYRVNNWSFNTSVQATVFSENLLGGSHEIKLGFEVSDRDNAEAENRTPGNVSITQNFITPQADFDGDGQPDIPTDPDFKYMFFERGWKEKQGVKAWAAFFSDTVSFGRFNLTLGLRYDYQHPLTKALFVPAVEWGAPQWGSQYFSSDTVSLLDVLLPGAETPALNAFATDGGKYSWKDLQPRMSLSYDIFGDGKTIAKLGYSGYSSWMGTGEAWRWRQNAGGWMGFYWWDLDQDNIISDPELYWYTIDDYALYPAVDESGAFVGDWEDAAGVFWGGFNYSNPAELGLLYNSIQPDAQSPQTHEFMVSIEREILPDFGIQVAATYRKYTDFTWSLKYFTETGVIQNSGWYEEANPVPGNIPGLGSTGEAANHPWYYTNAEGSAYSPWANELLRPDYYEDYWGIDIIFNKRLSRKWMFNGSFTLQDSNRHYGEEGLLNETNRWAHEGRPTSPGFVNYMVKLSGLYQFPFGLSASFSYLGRQGWIIEETFRIVDFTLPNPLSNSAILSMSPYGSLRLPFLHKLNFHLEKMFRTSKLGDIYVMLDVFNALNASTATNRSDKFHGTYYVYSDPELNTWVPDINSYNLNQILSPRVLRLGIRFQF